MDVEFDQAKARSNLAKHGITFEEAATCLLDPHALVIEDGGTRGEPRWILLGLSEKGQLLTVVYTLRDENPRLTSARNATRKEAISYA